MNKLQSISKGVRRSLRLIGVDPASVSTRQSQNMAALKSRLSVAQQKKVEFIADKIFELESLEVVYIQKKFEELNSI